MVSYALSKVSVLEVEMNHEASTTQGNELYAPFYLLVSARCQ